MNDDCQQKELQQYSQSSAMIDDGRLWLMSTINHQSSKMINDSNEP